MHAYQLTYSKKYIDHIRNNADLDAAIALWIAKDWATYDEYRSVLLSLIRSDYQSKVSLSNMQFIYFVNTHLSLRASMYESDRTLFLSERTKKADLMSSEMWQRASSKELWTVPF